MSNGLPAHLSYSSASSYDECPYRWKAERLHGLKQDPSVWLIGGSAFHEATELFDTQFEGGAFATDTIYAAFDNAVEKYTAEADAQQPDRQLWRVAGLSKTTRARPNGEDLSWWTAFGRELLDKYIAWRTTSPYDLWRVPEESNHPQAGQPAIEIDIPHVVGGVYVKGAVDRVVVDTRTGELRILDLKSGSRMPDTSKQLGNYKVGLEAHFAPVVGPVFSTGVFYNARKGTTTDPIPLDTYDADSVGRWYRDIRQGMEAGQFPPRPNAFCRSCQVQTFCPAFSGAAAQALPLTA